MPRQRRAHRKPDELLNDELGKPSAAASSGPVFGYGRQNPNLARKKFGKKNKSKRRD